MNIDKYINEQFQDAVAELEEFLEIKDSQLRELGWSWYLSEKGAPETLEELVACGTMLPISSEGCDKTIYSEPFCNQQARFWHSVERIGLEKNFPLFDKLDVIAHQFGQLHDEVSSLALKIFWADMVGQAFYYDDHKEFVDNQRAFVECAVQRGIQFAIRFKW